MYNLDVGNKLLISSTNDAVVTATAIIFRGLIEEHKVIGQIALLPTPRLIYQATDDTQIESISVVNGSIQSEVNVYLNGSQLSNKVFSAVLEPDYVLTLDRESWKTFDENGNLVGGSVTSRIEDSAGNSLTSTGGSLDVNVTSILAPLIPVFATRQDTFVAAGNGTIISVATSPVKYYAIQVKQTGVVTSWDVRLEGSLDGVNFTTILTHTKVIGDGEVVYIGALTASNLYFRSRCNAIVLGGGANIVVTILGTV